MQEQPEDFDPLQLTPENCVEELQKLAVHCKDASSQLRELLNLPLLDSLEEQAAGGKTLEQFAKSDTEIDRISRVSFAATQGLLLDQEDLLQTLKMVAQSFNNNIELQKLTKELSEWKPQQHKLSALDGLREPLYLYEKLEAIANSALVHCR